MRAYFGRAGLFWPAAALVALFLLSLVVGGWQIIDRFDRGAQIREEQVVANGFVQRIREVSGLAVPQIVWDEAVRNLDNRFDPDWAASNIGKYLYSTAGFDQAFVLDSDNLAEFASSAGRTQPVASFGMLRHASARLVKAVRDAEIKRGLLSRHPDKSFIAQPIQANTLTIHQGRLTILTATLVQPDFGEALPRHHRAPIVITAMTIDREFLSDFANHYLIGEIAFQPATAALPRDSSFLQVTGGLGWLVWQSPKLSDQLVMTLILPALLVILAFATAALLLARLNQRIASTLIDNEERITKLAYFDPLTELPNRVSLYEHLQAQLEGLWRGEQIAVFCIDLDRFKEVNDALGHHAGDELIRIASARMASQCDGSAYLARLSGDEFAIVQSTSNPQLAEGLAGRVCAAVRGWVQTEYGRVFAGCSIGVTLVVDGTMECAEVLRQADLALYNAKQNGRGHYCLFSTDMDDAIRLRQSLEHDLREALAEGALHLVYQPQVDREGRMSGVEALMRWTHPVRGPIAPSVFVPLAEECGLINELGTFAFRQAFHDSRQLPNLKIAVNVSANQLKTANFLTHVADLVREYEVDPARFELELTENIFLDFDDGVIKVLQELRAMGFSIALDDFGTGYSSLSYLQKFPIDKIKIDRSFISNLGVDKEADTVVAAIVKLARALKLSVIAEGVETVEQRLRLASTGCWQVQGYLYSRPVELEQITAMTPRNPNWSARAA